MAFKWKKFRKNLLISEDENDLIQLTESAQKLILELRIRDHENETFTQEGIIDGLSIVKDYIKEGEIGMAIEHLLYMVHESDISYPNESLDKLNILVSKYKAKNFYTD